MQDVKVKLAQAYGYCWGVERAVQMAYEARKQYPKASLHVTNEIIHNPAVNQVRTFLVTKGPYKASTSPWLSANGVVTRVCYPAHSETFATT